MHAYVQHVWKLCIILIVYAKMKLYLHLYIKLLNVLPTILWAFSRANKLVKNIHASFSAIFVCFWNCVKCFVIIFFFHVLLYIDFILPAELFRYVYLTLIDWLHCITCVINSFMGHQRDRHWVIYYEFHYEDQNIMIVNFIMYEIQRYLFFTWGSLIIKAIRPLKDKV